MEKKISNYSISLICCLLTVFPLWSQNLPKPRKRNAPRKEKIEEVRHPLYNGLSIGMELWGIGNHALGGDFLSSEVAMDINLKNRYLPTLELGYGRTNSWGEKGIHYKSSAPYFRIGMDYNTLYKKKHGHLLLVGLRYGVSSLEYDIEAMEVNDPVYGGTIDNPNLKDDIWKGSLPYSHKGMKGSMQWAEFCVGLRAHVWKALSMGWSLRFKFKLFATSGQYGNLWYMPGFGKYDSNTLGVAYTITYKLPL